MRRAWLIAGLLLGACESAEDVHEELRAELMTHMAAVERAHRHVLEAPLPVGKLNVGSGPPPCFARCDGHPNARAIELARLSSDDRLPGLITVTRDPEWLQWGRALASSKLTPAGRPLHEMYAPTLRSQIEMILAVRYLLVFRAEASVRPWIDLQEPLRYSPLAWAVERPDADEARPDELYLDASMSGAAFLYDLKERRVLGGVRFAADHELREENYTGTEAAALQRDLSRAARVQVRTTLSQLIAEAHLPFDDQGRVARP